MIRVVHPGSGGQKGNGSRISDPDPQHSFFPIPYILILQIRESSLSIFQGGRHLGEGTECLDLSSYENVII
jgi:hypothetical protein